MISMRVGATDYGLGTSLTDVLNGLMEVPVYHQEIMQILHSDQPYSFFGLIHSALSEPINETKVIVDI